MLISARTEAEFNQIVSVIMLLILLFGILLVLFIFRASFHEPIPKDRLRSLVGKRVYALNGESIGNTREVLIWKNHIYGINVDINGKNGKLKRKIIRAKDISNYGDVILVDSRILEKL